VWRPVAGPSLIHSSGGRDLWDTHSNYFATTETRTIISMVASGLFKVFPSLWLQHISHCEDSRIGNFRLALEGLRTELRGGLPEHMVNSGAIPLWRRRLRHGIAG
jgi:hypothetical protein